MIPVSMGDENLGDLAWFHRTLLDLRAFSHVPFRVEKKGNVGQVSNHSFSRLLLLGVRASGS